MKPLRQRGDGAQAGIDLPALDTAYKVDMHIRRLGQRLLCEVEAAAMQQNNFAKGSKGRGGVHIGKVQGKP